MEPDRGAKLQQMGYVALLDEDVKELIKSRHHGEGLEFYNSLTGQLLARIDANGIAAIINGPIRADLIGNVLGSLTGPVMGNVTGDVKGNVEGNVEGDVTGNVIGNLTGLVLGGVATYHGDSPITLANRLALLDGSGATCAMTLADGDAGQEMVIKAIDVTETCSVTPDNLRDGTTITFTDQYSAVRLIFDGTHWNVVGTYKTVTVA